MFVFFLCLTAPALCATPDRSRASSQSPFGVLEFLSWDHPWNQSHYDDAKIRKAILLMKEAGVGIVRMDFFWEDIEPRKGQWVFEKLDRIVDLLAQNGIEVLGLLHYNVSWASGNWNEPPDPALFTEYACQVVRHFKGRVRYWEIWNEPNDKMYWAPQDDLKTYAALLKTVYPAVKKEDPACQVLNGGLTGYCSISLKQLYRHGAKDCFDIVNIHPFTDPLLPDPVGVLRGTYRAVYKVMQANHDAAKPIWITELGCPGVPAENKSSIGNWWMGKNPDEAEQARWVSLVYKKGLTWPGVQKIFWAFFRDTRDHFKNGGDYFGLVREDFSKKPAFEAYRKTVREHSSSAL